MAKRHKRRAKERRKELLHLLNNVCKHCGTTENLTFDCIQSKGDKHHKYDTSQRMCFYWREHRNGNIQILCDKCNSKKRAQEEEQVNIPF